MKKLSKKRKQVLNKLKNASPNEVGDILKEYFNTVKDEI
jgi:hypothetical protein